MPFQDEIYEHNRAQEFIAGETVWYDRSGEQRFGVFEKYGTRRGVVEVWAFWGGNPYTTYTAANMVYRVNVPAAGDQVWRFVMPTGVSFERAFDVEHLHDAAKRMGAEVIRRSDAVYELSKAGTVRQTVMRVR